MNSSVEKEYVPGTHPDLPPPVKTTGLLAWGKQNLFSSPLNSVLTLLSLWFLWSIIPPFLDWAFVNSIWTAGNRQECWDQMPSPASGACWAFIENRFSLFTYGFYPGHLQWRVNLSFVLLVLALIPVLYEKLPYRKYGLIYSAIFPFITGWLLVGGFGLETVDTDQFGGIMLSLILGVTGISFTLPI